MIHRFFARLVFWKTGFTHWSSGPGNFSRDPDCWYCSLFWRKR